VLNGGLEEAADALSLLFDGQNKGKLVVRVSQDPVYTTVNARL
jgi:NADPH-dependent curcumin reductase CurA